MANAAVLVNGNPLSQTGTTGVNVAANSTITIALVNSAGVGSWSINCTESDGLNTNSAPTTINNTKIQNGFSATFTAPNISTFDGYTIGAAMQFTSIVNNGTSTQNTVTFGIWVLGGSGVRMVFNGENLESNATYGVATDINELNAVSSSSAGFIASGDLSGTAISQTVVGIQGNPVKAVTLGSVQDGYVPVWVNADSKIEFKSLASVVVDEATTTSLGTVQLAGDLGGSGTVGTAPTVGSLTGNASNVVSVAGTTPTIQSNAAATSLTIGTKKSGASLVLQGDNAATNITLASNSVTLGGTNSNMTTMMGGVDGYVNNIGNNNYTVDTGLKDYIILSAVATSSKTITLPVPVAGREIIIIDVGFNLSPTITLSIARHASENIGNVAASYVISAPGARVQLTSDGTNWFFMS